MGFLSDLFTEKSKAKSKLQAWGPAAGGLERAAGLIGQWGAQPQRFFPGQTYADYTADELAAMDMLRSGAGGLQGLYGTMMGPAAAGFADALSAPGNIMADPVVSGMAEAIQSRVNRNLAENILPGIRGGAATRGTLGGTGQQIAEALAGRGTQDVLSEQLANLYGGAYQTATQARQGAFGAMPGLMGALAAGYTQPAQMLESVGVKERAQAQRAIDEEMARFEFEQMEPYRRGMMLTSALMPMGQTFGTTERQTEARMSPFQMMGNLGYLASGMAGGLGGLFGGAPPMAASPRAQRFPTAGNRAAQMGWY